jgi:hypothetical protein
MSDGVYGDASYARLKTLSISYAISSNLMQKVHFKSCRVYLTGQNLLTLTHYKVGDPETQNYLRLAPLKTLVAGIQITL